MNVVGGVEVFERVGGGAGSIGRVQRTICTAVTRGIVEVKGKPGFPGPIIERVADPVSGRPRIDVETLRLISCRAARFGRPAGVTHLAELVDQLIREVEPGLLDGDTIPNNMPCLVPMLRGAQTLSTDIGRTEIILVVDIEGFDQGPGDGLDLVIEDQHIDIPMRISRLAGHRQSRDRVDIRAPAAERRALWEISLCKPEPAEG